MEIFSKEIKYVNANNTGIVFTQTNGFVLNKPTGIDTLSVDLSQAQGIRQIGTTIQSARIQPRPIILSGWLIGNDRVANKDLLVSVIRPDIDAKFYVGDYFLTVRPSATPTVEAKRHFPQFQASFLAAYPFWENKNKITVRNITGSVTVTNSGQVDVPFKLTLRASGQVEYPELRNAAGTEYILINKSMVAGEVITVEITHDRTYVNSTVDGECRGALDISSRLNRIRTGTNQFLLSSDYMPGNLTADIEYADELLGVTL